MSRLPDVSSEHPSAVLMPGQWCLGHAGGTIETLLGSCVAVTMWDPVTAIGACCHFVLPGSSLHTSQAAGLTDAGKYGYPVLQLMWDALSARGVPTKRCSYKIFGGGRMFAMDAADIGAQNIACARDFLRKAKIAPTAESVGDEGHRKIHFDLTTGAVTVQFFHVSGKASIEAVS